MNLTSYATVLGLAVTLAAFAPLGSASAMEPVAANPSECALDAGSIPSGSLPNCAVFSATVFNKQPGDCIANTPCNSQVNINWDFTSCQPADYAWTYNNCAQVGGASSISPQMAPLKCKEKDSSTIELGLKNPQFNPANCTGGDPIGTTVYSVKIWRDCNDCD